MEIRCDHKKHGEIDEGIISIKCSSRFCGAGNGVVVIHRWTLSGERLPDERFADPVAARRNKEGAKL